MLKRIALAAVMLLAAATTSVAQQNGAERVAVFQDWSVFVANSANGRMCFAVSQPTATEPTNVNRDAIYFYVSTWPIRGITNEANIIIGYPFAPDSTVSVTIDEEESFQFFTNNDSAWISNLDLEDDLIVAMQRGLTMVVRGTSSRGTNTVDRYSLRGISAALERVGTECN